MEQETAVEETDIGKAELIALLNRWPAGRVLALLKKVGGEEAADDILADKKAVRLEAVIRKLLDKHGRFIPFNLQNPVIDADYKNHSFRGPGIEGLSRDRFLAMAEAFTGPTISWPGFITETDKIIELLRKDRQLANLLSGVYLRILIPQVKMADHGAALEEVFLPAVEKAYRQCFPDRHFRNMFPGELAGKIKMHEGARYDKLMNALRQRQVPAVYFPTALQGFSVSASRELVDALPEDVILSGGYDIATALIGYPDILAVNAHTPGLDLSALQSTLPDCTLSFNAYDDALRLELRSLNESSRYSGGVIIT